VCVFTAGIKEFCVRKSDYYIRVLSASRGSEKFWICAFNFKKRANRGFTQEKGNF